MIKSIIVGLSGLLLASSAVAAQNTKTSQDSNTQEATANTAKKNGADQTSQKDNAEKNLKESERFFAENKKKPGVVTTKSGLQYKIIKKGTGNSPTMDQFINIQFRGTFLDGTEFEKNEKDGTSTFNLASVIPGWKEVFQIMQPGAEWIVYVPPNLGYGEKGVPGHIAPNAALIFEIKLDSIIPPPNNKVTDVLEGYKEE